MILEVLLPNHLPTGFDYGVPPGMELKPGDYVQVSFAKRELSGIVWGAGKGEVNPAKLKYIEKYFAHLPPMQDTMRKFLDWVSWYTLSPIGAVIKMSLPVPEALLPPSTRERAPKPTAYHAPREIELSGIQGEAAHTLKEKLGAGFSATLLDGVTGSGKTEVYFDAIAHALQNEEAQALVMLPEIALSVQWLERFRARFGMEPTVWHSGLTPAQRKHAWRAIVHGQAKVVVGARSALFLPFKHLRIIVVDEEHDASFKQEDGVVYQARDMAIARAHFEQLPVVLVSATPSIETLWNVQKGKYAYIPLKERHAGASFADIEVVDMRISPVERGAFLSETLKKALADNIGAGHQSLLFLNRRGYAPLLLCRACGYRFQCKECSSWLVMHKAVPRLQCHHCGFTMSIPKHCPDCQAEDKFFPCGPGVERVAEEVAACLPQARVELLTSDAIENYAVLRERIDAMEKGNIDILIGTQMIAKGHHFKRLTLVGIVDADLGLGGADLRASERTYQLLHQLAGRAGREKTYPGKVMIQTFLAGHPVMQALLSGDRDTFMEQEMQSRLQNNMPPYTRLAAIVLEAEQEDQVMQYGKDLVLAAPRITGLEIYGPAPAPLYLLRNRFRYRILVRAERNLHLQAIMQKWVEALPAPKYIKVKIDIDPYSFL